MKVPRMTPLRIQIGMTLLGVLFGFSGEFAAGCAFIAGSMVIGALRQ